MLAQLLRFKGCICNSKLGQGWESLWSPTVVAEIASIQLNFHGCTGMSPVKADGDGAFIM